MYQNSPFNQKTPGQFSPLVDSIEFAPTEHMKTSGCDRCCSVDLSEALELIYGCLDTITALVVFF